MGSFDHLNLSGEIAQAVADRVSPLVGRYLYELGRR